MFDPQQSASASVLVANPWLQDGVRVLATLVHHVGTPHDQRVEFANLGDVLVGVGQLVQHIAHGVEARTLFAVTFDHSPG